MTEQIIWPHVYPQAIEISTMREVRKSFEGDYDPRRNWLFVGTSNQYGSYLTLDEIEAILLDESDYSDPINGRYTATVLIVHPVLAVVKYGDVMVSLEDIEWMRGIVRKTVETITSSQERNV